MTKFEEIAAGVYRLGTQWVNWYLCDTGSSLTLIDCGFRGYYEQLPAALNRIGRPLRAVTSVVLTHYHADHVGWAQRLRGETGADVYAPAGDADGVRTGKVSPPPGLLAAGWRPAMARYFAHAVKNGGVRVARVADVRTFEDGQVLDLPTKLRAVHAPGHTQGHCALLAEQAGVLFAGDSLATVDFFTRASRPQLLPFNEDAEQAEASLRKLEPLSAEVVAPGHGEPFRGRPAEAIARALADCR